MKVRRGLDASARLRSQRTSLSQSAGSVRAPAFWLSPPSVRQVRILRWFVPLISRWIDRLVRHHPVQFRCAPDGVLLTLGTPWGLFRHYWILVKFLLTIGAITVLLVHTIFETVSPTVCVSLELGRKARCFIALTYCGTSSRYIKS